MAKIKTKCERCKKLTNQVCRVEKFGFFQVDKALTIIKRKRKKKVRVTKVNLKMMVRNARLDKKSPHLNHVNTNRPGILADNGKFLFLLDGNHRATKCFITNKTFYVYKLTPFEAGQCFELRPPKGMIYV